LDIPVECRIYVARHRGNDELAPSEELLKDFKKKSESYGDTAKAHNKAFKDVDYERRFKEKILNDPSAMSKLEHISRESVDRDIYFICYEGPAKACHRRILLRICEEKFGAKVQVDGVEP
jgi:Protein of unknown function, DUF488.